MDRKNTQHPTYRVAFAIETIRQLATSGLFERWSEFELTERDVDGHLTGSSNVVSAGILEKILEVIDAFPKTQSILKALPPSRDERPVAVDTDSDRPH